MSSGGIPGYDPRSFPPVAVTVDVVLFAIRGGALQVLLIERGADPFRGSWALPGGFVQPGDRDLDGAAERELAEETSVGPDAAYLEQLGTYGAADRDPRMRVISVAYWAACAEVPRPRGGSDAARAELVPVSRIEEGDIELVFDHGRIARDALDRLRAKLEYTALGARFCRPAFTITELRRVYEAVWNTRLDAGNFQRKVRYNDAFRQVEEAAEVVPDELRRLAPGPIAEPTFRSMAAPPAPAGAVESAAFFADDRTFEEADFVLLEEAAPAPLADQSRGESPRSRPVVADRLDEPRLPRPPMRRSARVLPRRRGGRPASLWSTEDPAAMLNSPIARPAPVGGDVDRC